MICGMNNATTCGIPVFAGKAVEVGFGCGAGPCGGIGGPCGKAKAEKLLDGIIGAFMFEEQFMFEEAWQ